MAGHSRIITLLFLTIHASMLSCARSCRLRRFALLTLSLNTGRRRRESIGRLQPVHDALARFPMRLVFRQPVSATPEPHLGQAGGHHFRLPRINSCFDEHLLEGSGRAGIGMVPGGPAHLRAVAHGV